MNNVKAQWHKYSELYNQRKVSERGLMLGGLLLVIYLVWEFTLYLPINQGWKTAEQNHQALAGKINTLENQRKALQGTLKNNPILARQKEIEQLQQRLAQVDEQIESLSVGLISANNLPIVIKDLIDRQPAVTLVGLKALKPEKLRLQNAQDLANSESVNAEAAPEQDLGVFKHQTVIRMKGHFNDILAYLTELEQQPWQFYWQSLDYQVTQYPEATVQLETYTLSTGKGFISD